MRIAIVSKSDGGGGGAGRVAEDLSKWLREDGHSVVHFARWGRQPYDQDFRSPFGNQIRAAKRIEKQLFMNDVFPIEAPSLIRRLTAGEFDVVHFHDLTTAYCIKTVSAVAERFPTVWTLHDLSAFTGGCCYPTFCPKIYSECGPCPKFGSWSIQGARDMTRQVQNDKREFFASFDGPLIAPSRWVGEIGSDAGFLPSPERLTVIPNGIDLRQYQAINRNDARRWLGLPTNRFIIAIISHDLNDKDKNPESQREALLDIADTVNPFIVLIGQESPAVLDAYSGFDLRHFGYVSDVATKNTILSASNIMLNTSLTDTFSLTTLESIASGTPVVAYATGGIPSILDGSDAGMLVAPDNRLALARALTAAAERRDIAEWSKAARRRAHDFSHDLTVEAHLDAYDKAVSR